MPTNIIDIGRAMIARGVALELVMSSGSRDRQAGLTTLLMEAGASATLQAIRVALGHWELEPIRLLLARGMAMTAPIAAALSRGQAVASLLPDASPEERQEALGLAA